MQNFTKEIAAKSKALTMRLFQKKKKDNKIEEETSTPSTLFQSTPEDNETTTKRRSQNKKIQQVKEDVKPEVKKTTEEPIQQKEVHKEQPVNKKERKSRPALTAQDFIKIVSKGDVNNVTEALNNHNVDINGTGQGKQTALHVATENNFVNIMQLLLNYGAKVEMYDKSHRTPLHIAVSKGFRNAVLLLLGNNAPVNIRDVYGYSPLHLALKGNFYDIFQDLLLFGGDVNFKKNDGMTCLHEAMAKGDGEAIKFLLSLPSHIPVKLNVKDEAGETPIFKAVAGCHLECLYMLHDMQLIDSGAIQIDIKNLTQQNLFHVAAQTGDASVMKMLLEILPYEIAYKFVNEQEMIKGQTPLHIATEMKSLEIVKQLVQVKANMDIQDNEGNTPLLEALINGEIEIARYLVLKGADVTIANKQKLTVEKLCKQKNFTL